MRMINPTLLPTAALFVVIATIILMLVGLHMRQQRIVNALDVQAAIGSLPRVARRILPLWMRLAFVLGLLLPLVALVLWWHDALIVQVFLGYVIVLVVQLLSEGWLSRIFPGGISIWTGLLYTAYRLWTLAYGIGLLANVTNVMPQQTLVNVLLHSNLVFWSFNLLFLLLIALPSLYRRKASNSEENVSRNEAV